MSKILLFWKSIFIFVFYYRFKSKNSFDGSLQKFIDRVQVHISNCLDNLPPPNHLQVQALRDSNKM
jgi:hypothetical protein